MYLYTYIFYYRSYFSLGISVTCCTLVTSFNTSIYKNCLTNLVQKASKKADKDYFTCDRSGWSLCSIWPSSHSFCICITVLFWTVSSSTLYPIKGSILLHRLCATVCYAWSRGNPCSDYVLDITQG